MTHPRRTALALAALAVLVYANAAGNGFALDDEFVIVNNEGVHGIKRIPAAVSQPYWPGAPSRIGLFRPLTAVTFAIEWELWGPDPTPFHVTNFVLHALVTVLVFSLLLAIAGGGRGRLAPSLAGAAVGAAVFAVHPVHTEAVANVVGRAELLATAFVLAAAVLYIRGDLTRTRRRLWGGAVVIAVAYFLGLAAKEIAVMLPGLLLVVEAGRGLGRSEGGSMAAPPGEFPGHAARPVAGLGGYVARVQERWPIFLAASVALAAHLGIRAMVLGTAVGNDAAPFFQPLSVADRLLTAVAVWPHYLRLMVFPAELVADYSPGVLMPAHGFNLDVAAGILAGAVAALAVAVAWKRARTVALGVAFFGVAVLPVSNLVIPIGVLLAERTLYLPSVGLALAVSGAWGWIATERPGWRPAVGAVLGLAVVLGSARTWVRTPTWQSTETVMTTLAADHPESFRVQWTLAERLQAQGRTAEALERYALAAELLPSHYQLGLQYARALLGAGRLEEALAGFRTARQAAPELPDAHVFLMLALLQADRPTEAVAEGQEALRWLPTHRGVHHQLAVAFSRAGDYSAALDARRESISLGRERAAWLQFVHEAELLLRLDRPGPAAVALEHARGRAPDPAAVPSLDALARAIAADDPSVLPYR